MKAKPATELILFLKITHTPGMGSPEVQKILQKVKFARLRYLAVMPGGGMLIALTS